MRLLFATLSRGLALHADDEITIVQVFHRMTVSPGQRVSVLPESVVTLEVEAQGLDDEEEQLFLDVLDADGRFARRLYQVTLHVPGARDGLPSRRYHAVLIKEGTVRIPVGIQLPQRMLLRLRLGARDVATLAITLR